MSTVQSSKMSEINNISMYDIFDPRNKVAKPEEGGEELMNLVCEGEFLLSTNPVHYEWCELSEDSDVWQ